MENPNTNDITAGADSRRSSPAIGSAEPLYETCDEVGHCPRPTEDAAPFHHFYWDCDRDTERMEEIHGPNGKGHDDPLSQYGAVMCKTCGHQALVNMDADDFPVI